MPSPSPLEAPLTSPAISTNSITAGVVLSEIKLRTGSKKISSPLFASFKELFAMEIISLTCNSNDDFTSVYNYSVVLSYEEFCDLGKTFKLCDNISDVFNTLKNIFEEISFSCNSIKEMKASARLFQNEGENIYLLIKIQLITGKFEEIKIVFKKGKRDIEEQFKKLKKKYLKIKSIVYTRKNSQNGPKMQKNLLEELLEEFENSN